MKRFKTIRKVDNNFVCWNCGKSHFYSPAYVKENLFCEGCFDSGLSDLMRCIGKLFKAPISLKKENN